MKIIVTGGAGFIGSHVVDAYIARGHKVAVIDNLSTGFRRNLNPKAKFYRADIRNGKIIGKIFAREKPETVNHHAARASVVESLRNPMRNLEANVLGTANLLSAFARERRGRGKFIFASTGGAIYGSPRKLPAGEGTKPNPASVYGLSKLLAEEVIKLYVQAAGIPYTILRYANVYGPRQNPKGEAGVVAIFGDLMKQGRQPTIFGDGSKTRDYVYVADVVQANVLALRRGNSATLNIGRGKEVSDQQIFETVAQTVGFKGRPRYAPFRAGEVRRISLDARLAKKILGWQPRVDLPTGIRRTV